MTRFTREETHRAYKKCSLRTLVLVAIPSALSVGTSQIQTQCIRSKLNMVSPATSGFYTMNRNRDKDVWKKDKRTLTGQCPYQV